MRLSTGASLATRGDTRPGVTRRLLRFQWERFPPASYGPLVMALVLGTQAAAAVGNAVSRALDPAAIAVGVLLVTAVLMQLRMLDEIRDEVADRLGHPSRPLPRGLVTASELRGAALALLAVGAALAASQSAMILAAYVLTSGQVWLLGVRRHAALTGTRALARQALAHSLITPSAALLTWLIAAPPSNRVALAATLTLVWGASLAIEVARKTAEPSAERDGVESYSRVLGWRGAALSAAVALAVACIAATVLATASTLASPLYWLPMPLALVVVAIACIGPRAASALRASVPVLVLVLLLWPLALAIVRG